MGGVRRTRPAGEGQRERADHGVPGARHVGDLVAPVDRNERRSAPVLEQGQPLRAARDEEQAALEALEKPPPRLLDGLVAVQSAREELLDLGLVRGRRGDAGEAREIVAGVCRHHRPGGRERPHRSVRHAELAGIIRDRAVLEAGHVLFIAGQIQRQISLAPPEQDLRFNATSPTVCRLHDIVSHD